MRAWQFFQMCCTGIVLMVAFAFALVILDVTIEVLVARWRAKR